MTFPPMGRLTVRVREPTRSGRESALPVALLDATALWEGPSRRAGGSSAGVPRSLRCSTESARPLLLQAVLEIARY